jgi:hypothetical protein
MVTANVAIQVPPPRPAADIATRMAASLRNARRVTTPFPQLRLADFLPAGAVAALRALAFPPTRLEGGSGRRELHNDQRIYLDPAMQARHPVCADVARSLQDPRVVNAFEAAGAPISGGFLRLELAQDQEGFWLEPHTDLGVKMLSLLAPLPSGPEQADLGTDLYRRDGRWAARAPFEAGGAMAFVPGPDTWHGFERRPFPGVRRSLIVNYVTAEWRAREQLAFPDTPVRAV